MIKLLKWELSRNLSAYLIVCALYCISMFLVANLKFVFKEEVESAFWIIIAIVSITASVGSFVGLLIVQFLMIINSFGKYLFGEFGHLLFCLPLKLDTILIAKILSNVILIALSSLLVIFVFLQVVSVYGDIEALSMYRVILEILTRQPLIIVFIIVGILEALMMFLLVLTLLNVWHIQNFRFIIGFCFYMGLYIVITVFSAVISAMFFSNFQEMLDYDTETGFLIYQILLVSLISVLLYLSARFLIIRKLELI